MPVGYGFRKTARATVTLDLFVKPIPNSIVGKGEDGSTGHMLVNGVDFVKVSVNGEPLHRYFESIKDRYKIAQILSLTDSYNCIKNICVNVRGGGKSGQAGAIALGLARALGLTSPQWYKELNAEGLLKRDARIVERKKPGQEKARKKFTWVKR
jgi:small subunit ribosomal protein S9